MEAVEQFEHGLCCKCHLPPSKWNLLIHGTEHRRMFFVAHINCMWTKSPNGYEIIEFLFHHHTNYDLKKCTQTLWVRPVILKLREHESWELQRWKASTKPPSNLIIIFSEWLTLRKRCNRPFPNTLENHKNWCLRSASNRQRQKMTFANANHR